METAAANLYNLYVQENGDRSRQPLQGEGYPWILPPVQRTGGYLRRYPGRNEGDGLRHHQLQVRILNPKYSRFKCVQLQKPALLGYGVNKQRSLG